MNDFSLQAEQIRTYTETIIFADLQLDQLTISRNSGTAQNLKDRRFDLYSVEWNSRATQQQEPLIKIKDETP